MNSLMKRSLLTILALGIATVGPSDALPSTAEDPVEGEERRLSEEHVEDTVEGLSDEQIEELAREEALATMGLSEDELQRGKYSETEVDERAEELLNEGFDPVAPSSD